MYEYADGKTAKPALHWQSDASVLPAGAAECTGHRSGIHGPPAGPVYPAVQIQAVAVVLPAGELECAGHPVHARDHTCTSPI